MHPRRYCHPWWGWWDMGIWILHLQGFLVRPITPPSMLHSSFRTTQVFSIPPKNLWIWQGREELCSTLKTKVRQRVTIVGASWRHEPVSFSWSLVAVRARLCTVTSRRRYTDLRIWVSIWCPSSVRRHGEVQARPAHSNSCGELFRGWVQSKF